MVTAVDQAGYWSPTLITTTTVTMDTTVTTVTMDTMVTMVTRTRTVSLAPCVMEVAGKRKHMHARVSLLVGMFFYIYEGYVAHLFYVCACTFLRA